MLCFEDDDEGHGPLDTHLLTTFSPHRAANCFCWDIYIVAPEVVESKL